MSLPGIALKRPVLALVLNILIIVFGIIGFQFLGIREYPSIDPPVITVRTSYQGANAEIIENQITEPLEKAINGISGVKSISSASNTGSSVITVEFDLNIDLEAAANDVRDKVSQAQRSLPQDLDAAPVVSKADANADAIISMTVQSTDRNHLEVCAYATDVLQERLQTIPGVSSIQIWGEKRYAMRLWIDPLKLESRKLSFKDVRDALNRENVELPAGKVSGNENELSVRTFGRLTSEEEFNNLIISSNSSGQVRLRDIGKAVLGPENDETILKESGTPMIALALIPQPGSNYIEIADEFYRRFEKIKLDIPSDIKVDIALDKTQYVKASIKEVIETLLIAFLLVVLIIYLFFRDWLIAIRPLIDIPVSLIGAFFIMYLFGYSINVLTLLAIVLATGLVVDDGIVVTENIFKKMESGMPLYKSAKEGSEEIFFAVIATSLTLSVVFLPIIFLQGFVGALFREFGMVVAGAVMISAFVSLTLTPVLNLALGKSSNKKSSFYLRTEPFFKALDNGYRRSLIAFLRWRPLAPMLIFVCAALSVYLYIKLPEELAPLEDRSVFRMSVTAPEGTSFEAMDRYMDEIGAFIQDSVPERKILLSVTSPGFTGSGSANTGFFRIVLTDPKERERTQQEIVDQIGRNLGRFSFGRAFPIQDQTISVGAARFGQPVQYVIQHNQFEKLSKALPEVLSMARESEILSGVDANLKFNKPEIAIEIDRLKAAELGVSVKDISETLQLALSAQRLGYFTMKGRQYQVIGQLDIPYRDEPVDIHQLHVKSVRNELVPLSALVSLNETMVPPQLYHYNRFKSATISAGLNSGYTIADGIKEMDRICKKVLDSSFTTSLTGSSRDFQESASNTSFAFVLALVLIYLILSAQFESFRDPLIIMMTVPLALCGALISLSVLGLSLNIFSQIGIIMLIGLVTKNGILIVEFANHNKALGISKKAAAIEGAAQRLRPILMTSLATILGALPIALALGAGAQSRVPLGVVVVGGLLFSLVLTLYIIPAIYSFVSAKRRKLEGEI